MYALAAIALIVLLALAADRANRDDQEVFYKDAYEDKKLLVLVHIRQDIKLLCHLVGGLIFLVGLVATKPF